MDGSLGFDQTVYGKALGYAKQLLDSINPALDATHDELAVQVHEAMNGRSTGDYVIFALRIMTSIAMQRSELHQAAVNWRIHGTLREYRLRQIEVFDNEFDLAWGAIFQGPRIASKIRGKYMAVANREPGPMSYYIPHHCVLKRFRVVFDASAATSNGLSLNEVQMVGEKLLFDIADQTMRFRRHKIGVVADIEKMYRQVGVDPSQWDLQRIFWRESQAGEIYGELFRERRPIRRLVSAEVGRCIAPNLLACELIRIFARLLLARGSTAWRHRSALRFPRIF